MSDRTVLFVSHAFPPVFCAGLFRTRRFVRYIQAYGWHPVVLSGTVDSYETTSTVDESLEIPANVKVVRAPIWRPLDATVKPIKSLLSRLSRTKSQLVSTTSDSNGTDSSSAPLKPRGFIKRIWYSTTELLFETPDTEVGWFLPALAQARRTIRDVKPIAIFTTGPPHSSHMIGAALKMLTGLPLILDLRDPWARVPWESNRKRVDIQRWLIQRIEKFCVRRADRIILNTEALRDDFRRHYPRMEDQRFAVITNGFDPEYAEQVDALRHKTANPHPVFLHPGSVYGKRDLRPLLDAVNDMGQMATVKQIGYLEDESVLREYVKRHSGKAQIIVESHQPHDSLMRTMAEADVLVVLQQGTRLQIPSKIFEMMLFKTPILALADDGATAELIRKYELGAVANPDDPGAVRLAVEQVLNYKFCSEKWEHARDAFNGENLTAKLNDLLCEIVDRS